MPTLTRHFLCYPNRSLYWSLTTLTTVGYGDISPTNITEMTYGVLMFVVGAVVYASIFANVTSLMGKFDEANYLLQRICSWPCWVSHVGTQESSSLLQAYHLRCMRGSAAWPSAVPLP